MKVKTTECLRGVRTRTREKPAVPVISLSQALVDIVDSIAAV